MHDIVYAVWVDVVVAVANSPHMPKQRLPCGQRQEQPVQYLQRFGESGDGGMQTAYYNPPLHEGESLQLLDLASAATEYPLWQAFREFRQCNAGQQRECKQHENKRAGSLEEYMSAASGKGAVLLALSSPAANDQLVPSNYNSSVT
ncbi:MAG: hypothetical protein FRX49_10657 [Trebouxia sp. A1-2]|nr:MAG: hypothetical protein FRX49_10657 [Trebouxia sp. A1-2]